MTKVTCNLYWPLKGLYIEEIFQWPHLAIGITELGKFRNRNLRMMVRIELTIPTLVLTLAEEETRKSRSKRNDLKSNELSGPEIREQVKAC